MRNDVPSLAPLARPAAHSLRRTVFRILWSVLLLLGAHSVRAQAPTIVTQPVGATNTANTVVSFTVSATGTGPLRYQWYFNQTNVLVTSGATTPTLLYTNVLKSHQGIYTVSVSNAFGAVTSAPVLLIVIDPPEVLRQPTNVLVAVGGTATFRVVAGGDPPLTYQWFFNVIEPILDATNSILVLTNVQPTNAGTYQVEITNPADTMHSHEAVLTVKFPPAIAVPPASLVVTQGHTATFEPIVSGDPPQTYQWFFNGTNVLAGATNTLLVLSNAQPAIAGLYSLRAANPVGVVTSVTARLTVLIPPSIVQAPTNLTVNAGFPASFTVTAVGDGPFAYQWFHQGTNALAGGTNATLLLPAAQASQAGAYTARVTGAAGAVTSPAALLTVITPPVIAQHPTNLTVFQGQLAVFTVAVSGSPPLTYQWFYNGTNRLTGVAGPALSLVNVQPAQAGAYSVIVTNRAGAATSEVALLTIKAPPVIVQQPVSRAATPGGTATFSVVAEGGTPLFYQWFFNAATALPDATNATLILTNLQAAQAGNYSVRVTNAAGTALSTLATLTLKQPPSITQQPASLIVTQGNLATFTVAVTGDGPFGYRWFFNETNPLAVPNSATLSIPNVQPANAGLYSVQVTNDAASTLSTGATLTVRVPPRITQQPADIAVVPGGVATFTVAAVGDAPLRYQWFFESNSLPDATNAALILQNIQLSQDGRYFVRVANDVGATNSATAFLRVRNLPTIAQAPSSLTVTQGHTAVFAILVGGDGPFSYQWFFNSTNPIPNATNTTFTLSNVPPAAAGAYSVRVTNLVGFVVSPEATLTVRLIPTITQQPAPLTVAVGATATFTVAVTGEAPFTYQWRRDETNLLADATNATLMLDSVQLSNAGRYSVLILNEVGSATSQGAALTVLIPPAIVQQPGGVVSTQRLSATFSVLASGDAPLSYQWLRFGTNPVLHGTNATLTLDNLEPSDAGEYSVRVTNLVGSVLSAPALLTVTLLPQITQQPASLIATQGQTAILSLVATNDLPLAYQWRKDGVNVASATGSSLVLNNIQPANGGGYDVIVSNARGAVTSSVATLTVRGLDFGDAPDPAFPTLLANDGARHVLIPGVFLGSRADAELDGQPTSSADGDDVAGVDDEDGVRLVSPLRVGQSASIEIVASTDGLLNAWIDFDGVGGWSQAGEQVFTNQTLTAGTNALSFLVPAGASPGVALARFRFSSAADLSLSGPAPDGEVEDYALPIAPAADLELVLSATDNAVVSGDSAAFLLRVINRGPSPATGVSVSARLSARSTFLSAVATQGACANIGGVIICDLGGLPVNGEADITLVTTIGQGSNTTAAVVGAAEFDPAPANNSAIQSIAGTFTLPQFANSDVLILPLPDSGPADPYPANILVSGAANAVSKVVVTLRNVNHDFPDDIDVLLVGPQGQAVILMSDCGFDRALVDAEITLSDDATEALPDNDPPIVTGTYRPANFGAPNDPFAAPAPPSPYAAALSAFKGTDPNGVWSLYVMDDALDNGTSDVPGFIADGWTLTIVTDEPLADLAVAATAPSSVPVGSSLIYSIVVTNQGPAPSSAVLRDVLPPGVTVLSAIASQGGCTNNARVITCDLGSLPSGGAASVTLQIVPTVAGGLSNSVGVSGNQLDLNPSNNSVSVTTTVLPLANLGVTMTGPPAALLGQPVNFAVTVSNAGPNVATGVFVTNVLPAGMTFVQASGQPGVITNYIIPLTDPLVVVFGLDDLPPGAAAVISWSGAAGATGINSNFASVAAAELDLEPANNRAFHLVSVTPAADLSVSAAPASANVAVGREFTTVLMVSNAGPSSADVSLVDTLPAGPQFVSVAAARGSCTQSGGSVQCQFTNLVPGESATVVLVLRSVGLGTFTNMAQVSGALADPAPANNAATNLAFAVPSADLALTMTDRPDPVFLGDDLLYTLAVTNNGPNPAASVSLTNVLPAGVSFLSAVLGQGSCGRVGNEVRCNLGTLDPGAGALVTLLVRPTLSGPLTNRASVVSQTIDTVPVNNAAAEAALVLASSGSFANPSPVLSPVLGPASPYPSTIFVSGLTASVFHVRVTLNNLSHSYADDLDVLLVGPGGQTALLMSDCGGDFPLNNVTLTFDDLVASALPDSGAIFSGVVRPSNFGVEADLFPAPAPAGTYGTNLAVFKDTDPNGLWSLYVLDDADKDSGLLAGGWGLVFTTLNPLADLGLGQAISANPAAVGSNVVFTYTVTNRGPAAAQNVRLTNQLPAFLASRSFTASQGACNFVGDSLICALGNLPTGGVATVAVNVTSLVSSAGTNSVTVSSDFTDLRPADNVSAVAVAFELPPVVTLQPLSRTVPAGASVQFLAAAAGAAPLQFQWQRNGQDLPGATGPELTLGSVSAADVGVYRLRVSNAVGVALSEPAVLLMSGPPVVSQFADLTIDEDTDTGWIAFTVQDYDTDLESLTLTRNSSVPSLVPPANIVFDGGGSNRAVRVTPLPNQFGTTVISVIVRDTTGAATTNQFLLTVRSVVDGIEITAQPRSLVVVTGATANLSVTANSSLALTYQWQRNEENLSGATSALLNFPNVQLTNAGTYRVLISNADTTVASAAVDLQIVEQAPGPTIVSITQNGSSVTIAFTTAVGASYALEYKDSFADAAWTPLNSAPGTGGIVSLIDPSATSPTRFYRVRVQ